MSKFAWVTLTTNDTYSLGALVLAHSLRRTGTAHQLAVLVTPAVSAAMRQRLQGVYNVVQEVNVLDSQDAANLALLARPELGVTFTKLHCWRLVQFEKCVFLDADTLVLQNSDELFEREELSAAPDVSWPDCFNSGVFVYRPSLETFAKITQFAIEHGSFDGGDQGLLNLYFGDWAQSDIKKHLPFIYNVAAFASYCYLPAFKQFRDKIKILHFAGKLKPWLIQFNSENRTALTPTEYAHAADLIQLWWNIFCDNVHQQLTDDMAGLAGALSQLRLGEQRTPEQEAYEQLMRRQCWEAGQIDYTGRDAFDNIWKKITQTLESKPGATPPQEEDKSAEHHYIENPMPPNNFIPLHIGGIAPAEAAETERLERINRMLQESAEKLEELKVEDVFTRPLLAAPTNTAATRSRSPARQQNTNTNNNNTNLKISNNNNNNNDTNTQRSLKRTASPRPAQQQHLQQQRQVQTQQQLLQLQEQQQQQQAIQRQLQQQQELQRQLLQQQQQELKRQLQQEEHERAIQRQLQQQEHERAIQRQLQQQEQERAIQRQLQQQHQITVQRQVQQQQQVTVQKQAQQVTVQRQVQQQQVTVQSQGQQQQVTVQRQLQQQQVTVQRQAQQQEVTAQRHLQQQQVTIQRHAQQQQATALREAPQPVPLSSKIPPPLLSPPIQQQPLLQTQQLLLPQQQQTLEQQPRKQTPLQPQQQQPTTQQPQRPPRQNQHHQQQQQLPQTSQQAQAQGAAAKQLANKSNRKSK
ncbi:putative mediator of RNA polymerase II transcription subunit 12 isoform X4 [Bactrocera neohumeralis]|uniref:putative mediator of RNA polymerase II transcription subunit 12 isoform X4 n=1 Tax=Bactrocera neohumeralis TaxID=98809 RepID=UPI002166422F|nr:putative mediator of RNA polymerase II transcription subunit 12 isoform X4 [Bactrocera neohumeralis]